MSLHVTQLEAGGSQSTHSIPHIVHFLPGCNEFEQSWRDHNPEFVFLSWDHESLERIVTQTQKITDVALQLGRDDLVLATILCYHYGGVVVTKPERCFASLASVLQDVAGTLFLVFAHADKENALDSSVIVSTAKIGAFLSLLRYLARAAERRQPMPVVFRDFVVSSMQASSDRAIVCAPASVKDGLTKPPTPKFDQKLVALESVLPASSVYELVAPSALAETIVPWLHSLGKTRRGDGDGENVGILVVDDAAFDAEAPVPQAVRAVLAFQDVDLSDDAIVFVAHSPPGGIGLDMMLVPQLQSVMRGEEIYRTDHVVWKLGGGGGGGGGSGVQL